MLEFFAMWEELRWDPEDIVEVEAGLLCQTKEDALALLDAERG